MSKPVVLIADPGAAIALPPEVFDPDRLLAVARTGLMDAGPQEALDDLAVLAVSVTGASRASITLVDAHLSYRLSDVRIPQDRPDREAEPVKNAPRQEPALDSPEHVLIGTGQPLVSPDAVHDPRIAELAGVREQGIGAWAGYPIHAKSGQVLGGLSVADDVARPWTAVQLRGLATLARAVSASIGMHQELDLAQLEITRLALSGERSAELARNLQDSLLPPVLICPPWLDAAAVYLPATSNGGGEVLGDFFDLFHTRDQWWCAVVGDVCGHGLEAAKVTALARYTIRAEATQHIFPSRVLHRLNQALLRQKISDRFLTAACVAIQPDPAGVRGKISLGGHPPALLRRADGTVTMVGRSGVLLGVLEDVAPTTDSFHLNPGDLLLLYTDGATEARNLTGNLLYEEGLADLLSNVRTGDAEQVLTGILDALAAFTGAPAEASTGFRTDDDTALLVLRVPVR
ncbi:MAG: GAF domain-containing SpoIIE family protein phosphatase [Streptosporangiaceae bacterium]